MAENEGMYVANRDVRVATTKGHVVFFRKDQPKYVPPAVREEMLAYGILPVNGDMPIKEDAPQAREPIGQARVDRVYAAVLDIVKRNDPKEFTAGGVPREDAMLRVTGFVVARKEINQAFTRFRQENAT